MAAELGAGRTSRPVAAPRPRHATAPRKDLDTPTTQ